MRLSSVVASLPFGSVSQVRESPRAGNAADVVAVVAGRVGDVLDVDTGAERVGDGVVDGFYGGVAGFGGVADVAEVIHTHKDDTSMLHRSRDHAMMDATR